MKLKIREELKTKEIEELRKLVLDSEDLIFKARLEKAQNKLKNLRQVFNERKRIALMKTLITQKTLQQIQAKQQEALKETEPKKEKKNGK